MRIFCSTRKTKHFAPYEIISTTYSTFKILVLHSICIHKKCIMQPWFPLTMFFLWLQLISLFLNPKIFCTYFLWKLLHISGKSLCSGKVHYRLCICQSSFKLVLLEKIKTYFFLIQQPSLKLNDNCASSSAPSSCRYFHAHMFELSPVSEFLREKKAWRSAKLMKKIAVLFKE